MWPAAAPFRYERGSVGVLLLHAWLGSPWEFRDLGQFLAARGRTVICPRLAGHGEVAESLYACGPSQWLHDADAAYTWLADRTRTQIMVGQCAGAEVGLLLHLARRRQFQGLVTLSMPSFDTARRASFLWRSLRRLRASLAPRSLPVFGLVDLVPMDCRRIRLHSTTPWRCYAEVRPSRSHESVKRMRRWVSTHLRFVTAPILIVHARHDHVYPAAHAQFIYDRVGSGDRSLLLLDAVTHILSTNVKKARALYQAIDRFIERTAAPGSRGPVAAIRDSAEISSGF